MKWRALAAAIVLGAIALAWWRLMPADREVQREVMAAVKVGEMPQPLAGMSARARIEVKPLVPRRIGADTQSTEYHRYLNRCHTCHAAPDPQLYTAAEWPAVIDRMHANMRAAGTLGLRGDDAEAIARFLARHGRR